MFKKKFIIIALLYIGSNSLFAQDTGQVRTLGEVVFSVNKWEQKLNEVPNKIVKINLNHAKVYNPQTTADLLGMTGAVFIQKSQLGGGSPMIRGFATNRVLIVVDGVRMNNAIYRAGNLQNVISIDALGLQNAEVIFGPGSLIYGSDAIGGVMDFHTLSPVLSTTSNIKVTGNAVARYSTANKEKTGHFDFSIGGKKWGYLSSVTYSDFDDLKMGKNGGDASFLKPSYVERVNNADVVIANPDPRVQRFTGYSQWNILQKIRFKPTEHWNFEYAFHYSATSNVPRYDRLIETSGGNPSFAEWYYGPQAWKMHSLQVNHSKSNSLYSNLRVTAAMQDYEESRHDRRLNNARIRHQTERVDIFSLNIDANKTISAKDELYYGVEVVTNDVGSFGDRININNGTEEAVATRYPNGSTWDSYAIYGSYKSNISEKVTLTTGLRYNFARLFAPFDTTFFKFPFKEADISDGAITGNLGLVYRPDEASQLNFNFSTGFRIPNVDDVGKVFESIAGQITIPNPNLKPEYAYNLDIGYARNISKKVKFDITAFYTILDNAIVRRPSTFNGQDSIVYDGAMSQVVAYQNVAKANVWGIQAGIEFFFGDHFSWLLQGNWIEGTETDDAKDEKVPLRHAPPFYGNTNLRFRTGKLFAELYAFYNGHIKNEDLAPSEQAKTFIYAKDANGKPFCPSWYTLNVKGGYSVTKNLAITLGLENLTNQQYRPYSSGIVAPGTNFIISLRGSF